MARIIADGAQRRKALCDIPQCLRVREKRGQPNGRFLLCYEWQDGAITLTLNCPECGGTHTLTIPIPKGTA